MRTAPAGERVARGGVPLPQLAVGLAVNAPDGLPLVQDLLEPVAGRLPARRLGGELLGLLDQRGLAGHGFHPGGGTRGVHLADLRLGGGRELLQPLDQPVDVADDVRFVQLVAQLLDPGEGVGGVAGSAGQARLDQIDLGHHAVVPAGEMGQTFFGATGLPRSDHPLTSGGLDVDRAVLIHPAESRPIAGHVRHPRVSGASRASPPVSAKAQCVLLPAFSQVRPPPRRAPGADRDHTVS